MVIITTDLHLSDRERDGYRWSIFPWLTKQLARRSDDELLILGDLTDEKDGHSSALVNRIVDTLAAIPAKITILKGNHDYTDEAVPFFSFLNKIEDITFVSSPAALKFRGEFKVLALPHTRTPVEDWTALPESMFKHAHAIICHQTFNGAIAGNGFALESPLNPSFFAKKKGFKGLVLSGDIHKPGMCGAVTYVGTPYPVAFGDEHKPRVLVLTINGKNGEAIDELFPPSIRKLVLTVAPGDKLDVREGDQVKVRLMLPRAEMADWEQHRQTVSDQIQAAGAFAHSIELREATADEAGSPATARSRSIVTEAPATTLKAFCKARNLSREDREAGQSIVDDLIAR